MRGRLTLAALLFFFGCSDPETGLLSAGTEVAHLVPDPGVADIPITVSAVDEFGPTTKDIWIPPHSHLVVLEDKAAEPPVSPKLRIVRVPRCGRQTRRARRPGQSEVHSSVGTRDIPAIGKVTERIRRAHDSTLAVLGEAIEADAIGVEGRAAGHPRDPLRKRPQDLSPSI